MKELELTKRKKRVGFVFSRDCVSRMTGLEWNVAVNFDSATFHNSTLGPRMQAAIETNCQKQNSHRSARINESLLPDNDV